jgi:WD40 repeat protein
MIADHAGLLQFTEDDTFLAAALGTEVLVLDPRGKVVSRLTRRRDRDRPPKAGSVAISRQAGMVAAGYSDGTICVWSLDEGKLTAQRSLTQCGIDGLAFAVISGDRASERRRRASRPSRPEPYIFFTACHQPAMVLARDLRLPRALPCDTDPLHELFFVTTVAAAPNGDYLAAGRDNGDVLVWKREGSGYERIAVLRYSGRVIRVLLHIPPSRHDEGVYLYVAAESDKQLSQREGDQACEISSWRFGPAAPHALIATTSTHDVSDIAVGRYRRTVISSHETRLPVDRYRRPPCTGL